MKKSKVKPSTRRYATVFGNFKHLYEGEGNLRYVALWGIGVYDKGLIRIGLPNHKSVFVGDMPLEQIYKDNNFTAQEIEAVEYAIKQAA
ncbi:MAG: hypothetical protein LBF71_05400 [Campylobacteraceae bacterium]|jgi:hypothetical protein|nr:hypothetical protein [Campylobacteraceae bacterium]